MSGNSWQSPNSGEPSAGEEHSIAYASRSTTLLVNTSTNTGGTWSAAVTVANVPQGTTEVLCNIAVSIASGLPLICVEKASGVTLDNITASSQYRKYRLLIAVDNGLNYGLVWIPVDSSFQFKWCTYTTNTTVQIYTPVAYKL
jgi:hypothetical protein